MPLSEREQQILQEIEKRLYEEDPAFARDIRPTQRDQRRHLKLGIALFVVGLATLVAFFVTELWWVAVVAYGAMVAAIVLVANAMRSIARDGSPGEGVMRFIARCEQRLRDRYKRD